MTPPHLVETADSGLNQTSVGHDEHAVAPLTPPPPSPPTTPLAVLARRLEDRSAMVAVVGLGYVGLPLLVAADGGGFGVIGLDADQTKVQALRAGSSYVGDVTGEELAGLDRVQFTTDHRVLVAADVVVIAVPTPLRDGGPDLSSVRAATEDVARVLRPGQLVVLESTTYPGTTEDLVRPILERRGLLAGRDFALAYSPERINPGSGRSVRSTPKVVAGVAPVDTDLACRFYGALVDAVVPVSAPRNAEMAKLVENTFRQVNIALVNELATIASAIGVDIWEALDAAATKPFGYLPFWPGAGVGGHCIAIDPSYLSWKVEQRLGFGIGFIEHARSVNNRMPAYVAGRVAEALNQVGKAVRGARVLVLGLSYKAGVDDVRESPALRVLRHLVDAGADCSYHDDLVDSVNVSRRRGGDAMPATDDGERLLSSVALTPEVLGGADCVVILTAHPDVDYDTVVRESTLVFDATGTTRHRRRDHVILL
ncbi:MAG TPA: nucleotide sugar dehydrogenase [Acidimicrobiales bacterium]|nr:nucleotide sugar dehydrogenase [Acidimicrobiales bacterium]